MTLKYRGLQGVTRGYRGLQGVTRGYKGLQGVTRGYKEWKKVTGGYRGLQRIIETFFQTRTFPDTFSCSILHKNQSGRNLKFFTKTMDWPLWKNFNFAFFVNGCFYSLWRHLFCLERQQTVFLDLFLINTRHEKTSTFWQKSWTIPFAKMTIFAFFLNACLYWLERLLF